MRRIPDDDVATLEQHLSELHVALHRVSRVLPDQRAAMAEWNRAMDVVVAVDALIPVPGMRWVLAS